MLKPGQSVSLDGYTLTNTGLFQTREQNSITARVRLALTDHGQPLEGSISPGIRQFDPMPTSDSRRTLTSARCTRR